MYNATIKTTILIFTLILLGTTSCSNKEEDAAAQLYSLAEQAFNEENYTESISIIDSLQKTYPKVFDVQKKAIHLWAQNNEKIIINEMLENDIKCSVANNIADSLKSNFKYIKTKDMVEGYKVDKSVNSDPNKTGIEVRIGEDNNIYIISSVVGKNINHEQISVSNNNTSVSSKKVVYNGSTNYRFKDAGVSHELVTFRGAESDSICLFISQNISSSLKINFIGKKTYSQTLSKKEKQVISRTFEYASALKLAKETETKKMYFTNKLQVARNQMEKTKL